MVQLFNAECLTIMNTIPDNSIDMVFCDLPYGITRNHWDSIIDLLQLWSAYRRIVKDNGAIVLTAANPFDKILAMSNLSEFKYDWIWEKNKATGHLNAKKMPLKSHEYVLVFYKTVPVFNPQFTYGHKPMNSVKPKLDVPEPDVLRNYGHVRAHLGNSGGETTRYPRSVIGIPVINNDSPLKWHPTQKPVELAEYFIKTYSNEEDTVLDNCMGSGSTGIACLNTNRNFIGIEINKDYFDKAHDWINESANSTLFSNESPPCLIR